MALKYKPPACGNHAVIRTVPGRTFWGWRCADCDGPLRLTDRAASLMTGHPDPAARPGDPLLVHDMKSDFYWENVELSI